MISCIIAVSFIRIDVGRQLLFSLFLTFFHCGGLRNEKQHDLGQR
jgi:hypothetical protein